MKKLLVWGGLAFLAFLIANQSNTVGNMLEGAGGGIFAFATGLADLFADIWG